VTVVLWRTFLRSKTISAITNGRPNITGYGIPGARESCDESRGILVRDGPFNSPRFMRSR
jgi:hypothetical protein